MKKWRIISYVVYSIFAIAIIVLSFLGGYKIISNPIDLITILVSLFAVCLTVLENKIAKEIDVEQKYTQFVIEYLQKTERNVSDLLAKAIKSIESCQERIDLDDIASYLLKTPIYKEKLRSYFMDYSAILNKYQSASKTADLVNNTSNELFSLKARFEIEINELIKKLYTGEIKIPKEEKNNGKDENAD